LRNGQTGVYIALDDFPEGVRELIARSGFELEAFERKGRFFILDCYSSQVGRRSSEKYFEDPRNLSNLSIAVSGVLQQGKPGAVMVILDSLTTLIQKCGVTESLGFLHILIAKIRSQRAGCIIKFNSAAFNPAVAAAVQDIVDGVIETKAEETPVGVNYCLRILKMRGTRHLTTWNPYIIDPKLGLLKNWLRV
jgi:KaiC/GvpD/RAD55 family RecA-like ATPase